MIHNTMSPCIIQVKTASSPSSGLITTFPLQLWNKLHPHSYTHVINLLITHGCGWGKVHPKSLSWISTISIINDNSTRTVSPCLCDCVCVFVHMLHTPSPITSPRLLMQPRSYYSVSLLVDCHPISPEGRLGALQPWLSHEWLQQQEVLFNLLI